MSPLVHQVDQAALVLDAVGRFLVAAVVVLVLGYVALAAASVWRSRR